MTGPAFILGNGPTLPVERLALLKDQFTIGVNRVLRSGFTPTVILWGDVTVYQEDGQQMDASGALLVCDRSVACRQHHHGLKTWVGNAALRHASTPATLCCNGNTGCCAARWALALGCQPVYLLGMSATYEPGRTDFYGNNRWHGQGTLGRMRDEILRLEAERPGAVRAIRHGAALEEIVSGLPARDPAGIRQQLLRLLREVSDVA